MVKNKIFFSALAAFWALSVVLLSCKQQIGIKNDNTNQPINNKTAADTILYTKLSPFGIDYSEVLPEETKQYKLMIVEPAVYNYDSTELEALKAYGTTILGYISLGEVDPSRPYFNQMKKLGENSDWGSYYIDLSDSATYNLFIEEIIPEIMKSKVDGLFFDTVDDYAPYTSDSSLAPYMIKLIKQIRTMYPNTMLIMNDGLFLLDSVSDDINGDLQEDIATNYDFNTQTYQLADEATYQNDVQMINQYSQQYNMPFLLVDYAVTDSLKKLVEARLNKLPYPYFITDINVDNLTNTATGNNY